jgi:hypothetical protein
MQEFEPKINALATTQLEQQNFVYDDIDDDVYDDIE